MKKYFIIPLALFLITIAYSGESYNFQKDLISSEIADIDTINISNINGNISIQTGPEMNLEIKIVSKDQILKDIDNMEFWEKFFSIEKSGDQMSFSIKHIADNGGFSGISNRQKAPSMDIFLKVPDYKFNFSLSTVNGSIDTDTPATIISAKTVNGNINIANTHDKLDISSVNGHIIIEVVESVGSSKAKTINGSISAYIHPQSNIEINAKSFNGKINLINLDLNNLRSNTSSLRGILNQGTNKIMLKSMNGPIFIKNIIDKN